jgi:hypothetical protein
MRYRPVFSDTAVLFFTSISRRKQEKLLDRAQELARDPFLVPDFRSPDEEDRVISHILIDGFLFSSDRDDC